jgi:hypothetical protein
VELAQKGADLIRQTSLHYVAGLIAQLLPDALNCVVGAHVAMTVS